MNTHAGYSKKTITDTNVLLAGGGDKSLADFLGGIQYVSASRKLLIKTAASGANWTDLVTLPVNSGTANKIAYYSATNVISSGTIDSDGSYFKKTFSASDQTPLILINGGNYDNCLWKISGGTTTDQYFGYALKYIGTGSGASNFLRLYADNQNGTDVIAIGINQSGQIGIGTDAITSARLYVDGMTNFSNKLGINGDGKMFPSANTRSAGVYGVYNSQRLGHIWSIGTDYAISNNGADPNTLYGMAHFHTNWSNNATYNTNNANKTPLGTYAEGHQIGFFNNGILGTSIGLAGKIWTKTSVTIDDATEGLYLTKSGTTYGKFYIHTVGTTDTEGITLLVLGNNTATGNANNASGVLRIFQSGNYTLIKALAPVNRNVYLPNYSGSGSMYLLHYSGNGSLGSTSQPIYLTDNGRVAACSTMALAGHTHDHLISQGNQSPEMNRLSIRGGVYTYNSVNNGPPPHGNTMPDDYTSVIGFGRNTSGHSEICTSWTGGGVWYRFLRDTVWNWSSWNRIYDDCHDIIPSVNATYNIGAPNRLFNNIFFNKVYLFGRYYDDNGDPELYDGRGAATLYSGKKGDIEGSGDFIRIGSCWDPWTAHPNTVADIGNGSDYISFAAYCKIPLLTSANQETDQHGANPYGGYIHFPALGKFFITTGNITCETGLAVYFNATGTSNTSRIRIYAPGSAFGSDRRIKRNIESIPTSDLEDLYNWSKTHFRQFNFLQEEEKSYGVIAQEMEEILPEVVVTAQHEEDDYEHDKVIEPEHFDEETGELIPAKTIHHIPDFKHLDYIGFHNKLLAAMINEIEKLKAEISELKNNQSN